MWVRLLLASRLSCADLSVASKHGLLQNTTMMSENQIKALHKPAEEASLELVEQSTLQSHWPMVQASSRMSGMDNYMDKSPL